MPKKVVDADGVEIDEVVEKRVENIDMNLYRDDLNAVVAKLNEVIDTVNNL